MNFQIKKSDYFILIIILSLGIFFAYHRGSNFSDGDAYSVILAYLNYFTEGIYNPSRGAYGHPIPELLIGFISYNFTPISNVLCFSLFFFSILILFRTYFVSEKNIALFVLLIVSNSYLFLENTNSTDYPVAFFFFSLGLFFLKKAIFFFIYFFWTLNCV